MAQTYDFNTQIKCTCAFQRFVTENKDNYEKLCDFIDRIFGSHLIQHFYYVLEQNLFDVGYFYVLLSPDYQNHFCSCMKDLEL